MKQPMKQPMKQSMAPDEVLEARRLLSALRAWALVLRDSVPRSFLPVTAAERITATAWQQFTAVAARLEALLPAEQPADTSSDTQEAQEPQGSLMQPATDPSSERGATDLPTELPTEPTPYPISWDYRDPTPRVHFAFDWRQGYAPVIHDGYFNAVLRSTTGDAFQTTPDPDVPGGSITVITLHMPPPSSPPPTPQPPNEKESE